MLVCDPPRPPPGEPLLQRLRFTEPLKRTTSNVLNQIIDLSENFEVILLPMQIVFPPFI
jgi:hypothetical protein